MCYIKTRFSSCPCCRNDRLVRLYANPHPLPVTNWRQFYFGGREFLPDIIGCGMCGYHFLNYLHPEDALFYQTLDLSDFKELTQQRRNYFTLVRKSLESAGLTLQPKKHILDIGCGNGEWLETWHGDVIGHGIEIHPDYIVHLRKKGFAALSLEEAMPEGYAMVSLFDVLEHVAEPSTLLEQAATLVCPGGHLVLGVPDMGRWIVRMLAERYYLYCPAHYSYFTRSALLFLIKNTLHKKIKINIFPSPPMGTSVNGVLKWLGGLKVADNWNFQLPIGYRASMIVWIYLEE
ncbi:MAG: class I SAM-dependent methyltransferase [Magnetococcus sp. DMHC-6]